MRWYRNSQVRHKPEWMQAFTSLSSFKTHPVTATWLTHYSSFAHHSHFTKFINSNDSCLKWLKSLASQEIKTRSAALQLLNIPNFYTVSKWIQRLPIRRRIKNFLWELYSSKLPLRRDEICPLCNELTTGNHILRCKYTHNIIKKYLLPLPRAPTLEQLLSLNTNDTRLETAFALLIWSIWRTFNTARTEDTSSPDDLLLQIYMSERHKAIFSPRSLPPLLSRKKITTL